MEDAQLITNIWTQRIKGEKKYDGNSLVTEIYDDDSLA